MGLHTQVAPLFTILPVEWEAPCADEIDSILITSANAARHAGRQLNAFLALPCFAVGETSAAAARAAGFTDVRTGDSDGEALLAFAAEAGMKRPLHLCGREHIPVQHDALTVQRRIVYAAEAVACLPELAVHALRGEAMALLHSPRAAALFAQLVDQAGLERSRVTIASLSEQVAGSAGRGWQRVAAAEKPTDEALLELAAKLCQTSGKRHGD
jgi:uroporphyrinogen-III synthase